MLTLADAASCWREARVSSRRLSHQHTAVYTHSNGSTCGEVTALIHLACWVPVQASQQRVLRSQAYQNAPRQQQVKPPELKIELRCPAPASLRPAPPTSAFEARSFLLIGRHVVPEPGTPP
ncbi:unnamed protein product [Rangifer tarandus platyrhynchus]|uniref:Uncharacterized protein n=1 Tax=Rangifer tarandus platyrhynchus TaxID=3082113 RepID=A0AC59ZUN2_RANTA